MRVHSWYPTYYPAAKSCPNACVKRSPRRISVNSSKATEHSLLTPCQSLRRRPGECHPAPACPADTCTAPRPSGDATGVRDRGGGDTWRDTDNRSCVGENHHYGWGGCVCHLETRVLVCVEGEKPQFCSDFCPGFASRLELRPTSGPDSPRSP